MATVRAYVTDALLEIGRIEAGETPDADSAQLALRWFRKLLDSYRAERAAMAVQKQVQYAWPSGQSYQTIGPTGADITTPQRPTWLDIANYQNPGSSPSVWVSLSIMTPDVYAQMNIPGLQSSLPQAIFYQTSNDTLLGTLFLWPQITQTVNLQLYFQVGLEADVDLDDILLPPPGYEMGLHFQLAEVLLNAFAIKDPTIIGRVLANSEKYYARMKRPNLQPGQLGVDPAVAGSGGMGYNVLTDSISGYRQ